MQGEQPPNQMPPNRLVLPGADDTSFSPEQRTQFGTMPQEQPEATAARPTQIYNANNSVRSRLSTGSMSSMSRVAPPGRTKTDWRKDPAYKFLFIALGVVLIASILFIAFAGSTVASIFNQSGTGTTQTNTGGPSGQGTVDTHPQFPTPGGNTGVTATSQPVSTPTTLPTPSPTVANPTPTTQPSPTPTPNSQLTLQIVNAPGQVSNNSTVTLNITSSQPDVQVTLTITYDVPPYFKQLGPQTTDNNGNASFQWNVQVHFLGRNQGTARIVATGRNQNGQAVSSQMVTVKIVGRGGNFGG